MPKQQWIRLTTKPLLFLLYFSFKTKQSLVQIVKSKHLYILVKSIVQVFELFTKVLSFSKSHLTVTRLEGIGFNREDRNLGVVLFDSLAWLLGWFHRDLCRVKEFWIPELKEDVIMRYAELHLKWFTKIKAKYTLIKPQQMSSVFINKLKRQINCTSHDPNTARQKCGPIYVPSILSLYP